jgi:hypothetical protein
MPRGRRDINHYEIHGKLLPEGRNFLCPEMKMMKLYKFPQSPYMDGSI